MRNLLQKRLIFMHNTQCYDVGSLLSVHAKDGLLSNDLAALHVRLPSVRLYEFGVKTGEFT